MTDWSASSSKLVTAAGTKALQTDYTVDRTYPYRQWRRLLGHGLYVNDIDQLEWRMRDGMITPVAVLELTRVEERPVSDHYFDSILQRMRARDPQANVACEVASRCGTDAYIVAWRADCSTFWVYNLSDPCDWSELSAAEYFDWLKALR